MRFRLSSYDPFLDKLLSFSFEVRPVHCLQEGLPIGLFSFTLPRQGQSLVSLSLIDTHFCFFLPR